MRKFLLSCLVGLFGVSAAVSMAAEPAAKASDAKPAGDPRAIIAAKFPGVKPEEIKPAPIPGMYEVAMGADTAYVSADGKYLINGDLYQIDSRTNLTEANRSDMRRKAIAKLDERDMIIFSPAAPKYTVTVFTDVECAYCRKLHSEIAEINKLGVRVRYMAYPRAGPGTDDWHKMESVWCSKDRKSAITHAKQGEDVKSPDCGTTPVAKQYALGEKIGVNGTPAVFTDSGDYIGGYLPAAKMLEQLQALDQERVAATKK
jgi:thiol:disulfide interchange protein DsbC